MLAGDLYIADDPELAAEALRAARLLDEYNRSAAGDATERRRILMELLASLGAGSEVRPPLRCDHGYHLRIGARTFVNLGLVALDVAPITIGDDVQIGPNVQLLTPTHPSKPSRGGPNGRDRSRSPSQTTDGSEVGPSCCLAQPLARTPSWELESS